VLAVHQPQKAVTKPTLDLYSPTAPSSRHHPVLLTA